MIGDQLHVVLDPEDTEAQFVSNSQQVASKILFLLSHQARRWLIKKQ